MQESEADERATTIEKQKKLLCKKKSGEGEDRAWLVFQYKELAQKKPGLKPAGQR